MATSSVNFVSSLGAGSGIDTKALAQSLVDAERTPRKDRIDAKIAKEEARITGHGAIKYSLSQLQSALAKFKDASQFASINPSNSQPSAFGITTDTRAGAGTYNIEVSQIAKATRLATAAMSSTSQPLNSGAAFTLDFNFYNNTPPVASPPATTRTQSVNIPAGSTSLAGIVNTVNASSDTTGIRAQLVKTGVGYSVTFTGPTGAGNAFEMSGLPADLSLMASPLQSAQDAKVSVDGLDITSQSNAISDAIEGVTLDLYAPTTAGSPARLDLSRQTTSIKDSIKALVTAYNEFDDGLTVLGDKDSKVQGYGGTMVGDSLLNTVRSQIRTMLTKDAKVMSTPADANTAASVLNPDVYAARHVGLSFDRNGKLTLDETKLDKALSTHFDQVVTMFTANKSGQSIYSPADGGLAGNAVKNIDKMLRTTGVIDSESNNANVKIKKYKEDLTQLEDRMQALLTRYTKQFSVMDSIVGQSNSTRTSLTNTFKAMTASSSN
jgi:flagellar hook-associated protein 2